jgi:hypothetical protein
MAERRTTHINVYERPAVEAQKGEPMLTGTGWRIVNVKGTREHLNPAINFQASLLTTFYSGEKRFAVLEIRDWPDQP